jgi:hypothetical protein
MLFAFRLRGTRGSIVWGYHTAVALGEWKVKREQLPGTQFDTGWRLRASVTKADVFLSQRRPLYFTAPHHKGQWCWPVEALMISGTQLMARLRAPEQ